MEFYETILEALNRFSLIESRLVYIRHSLRSLSDPNQSSSEGLESALSSLSQIDSGKILVLRKLHRLASCDVVASLCGFFRDFGHVQKVILLPSRRRCGRLRPSTTGFVVMGNISEVEPILANGQLCIPFFDPTEAVMSSALIDVGKFEFPTGVLSPVNTPTTSASFPGVQWEK
jgi:hypothetical protein